MAAATPEGWQRIRLDDDLSLAVPPDAVARDVRPIDSVFGMLGGEGYEVAYDYGRSGDDLALYAEEPGFSSRSRDVAGRPGTEVEFRGSGAPWAHVRMLQVHVGANVLTVRMNCVDADTCRTADVLFDSVGFGPV